MDVQDPIHEMIPTNKAAVRGYSPRRAAAPLNQFLLGDFQLQNWRKQSEQK